MTIICNGQYRPILDQSELTAKEFDNGAGSQFFRYRGNVYSLGDFMRFDSPNEWDGYLSTSVFSAILVKISKNGESVLVASEYS